MPTYSMSAPDGNTYRIDGPAGASDEQVRAEILKQHPNAGTAGGAGGTLGRVASGLWRGLAHGMLPSDVMHYDPVTKHYVTGESRQEAAAEPTDRTSRLSELAGEMMVQPWIGGAKAADMGGRLLTGARAKPAVEAVRAAGQAVGGSGAEVRATDRALGTLGQRTGSAAIQRLEQRSASLPGGAPLRQALTRTGGREAVISAEQIAANMGTAAGKFKGFSEGRALASQTLAGMLTRDAKGAVDADKFMQQWMEMAPEQRDAIFGAKAVGGEFGKKMTELATNIEKIQALANKRPLRDLAAKVPHKGAAGAALLLTGLVNANTIIHTLLDPKVAGAVAAGVGLVAGSNRMLAYALTNPSTVAWLAAQSGRMLYSLQDRKAEKGTYDEPLSNLEGDLR